MVAAYGRSNQNRQDSSATEDTELLQVVIRSLRGLYALAPGYNVTYFAGFAEVDASAESGGPDNQAGSDRKRPRPSSASSAPRTPRAASAARGTR